MKVKPHVPLTALRELLQWPRLILLRSPDEVLRAEALRCQQCLERRLLRLGRRPVTRPGGKPGRAVARA